ncbi:Hypothetical protein R9X50_00071800 [Acrodontium crateriforme]|uniref:Uncharacterized protein n=1 Tax=Acrodontium crateriforme TaxID=150365 RepID=A0AAQ3R279_9PEZI|nr:Hypothetical protein R9X50_00071800 [Acrodontium crateriforme]
MNGQDLGEGSLKSFYGYKETFGNSTVWVDIPQQLTFVHTNNPYEDLRDEGGSSNSATAHAMAFHDTSDGIDSVLASGLATLAENANRFEETHQGNAEYSFPPYLPGQYATHGLEALSAVASQDQYNYAPPPAQMINSESSPSAAQMATAQHSLEQILTQAASADSNIDPALHTDNSVVENETHQLVTTDDPTAS